jgi:hypothetical protein
VTRRNTVLVRQWQRGEGKFSKKSEILSQSRAGRRRAGSHDSSRVFLRRIVLDPRSRFYRDNKPQRALSGDSRLTAPGAVPFSVDPLESDSASTFAGHRESSGLRYREL